MICEEELKSRRCNFFIIQTDIDKESDDWVKQSVAEHWPRREVEEASSSCNVYIIYTHPHCIASALDPRDNVS